MAYNLSNFTDANTIVDVAIASNELTGGVMFNLFVILAWVVVFTSLVGRFDAVDSALSASFITVVLTTFLWLAGLMSESWLLGVYAMLLLLVVVKMMTK